LQPSASRAQGFGELKVTLALAAAEAQSRWADAKVVASIPEM
jgi:hypothetical protein